MIPTLSIRNPIAVSLGAIAGALCRYYLNLWLPQIFGTGFPYATLLVNLTGSFTIGVISTLAIQQVGFITPEIILLLVVGFLGSYTTFSSYELDSLNLWRGSGWQIAFFYWFGSAVGGFFSLYLGILLAKFFINAHHS
ncbi:camphor resistance protein CrcB [Chondrocystis sp. NIES-4102]|nr:camphor resistance protein CrcB [Chondrocystis sp. NIES-4102]